MYRTTSSDMPDVLILAGGLGTRLKPRVSDLPKALAQIAGRPFLSYLLEYLETQGVSRCVISTGYLADKIRAEFGNSFGTLELSYIKEETPLGTGGAVRLALDCLNTDPFLVMNGDSFVAADLRDFVSIFDLSKSKLGMVVTECSDVSRFGSIKLGENSRIQEFVEKGIRQGAGLINAGMYILTKELFDEFSLNVPFSIEHDFFPKYVGPECLGYQCSRTFIDIGTPESFDRAQNLFQDFQGLITRQIEGVRCE